MFYYFIFVTSLPLKKSTYKASIEVNITLPVRTLNIISFILYNM